MRTKERIARVPPRIARKRLMRRRRWERGVIAAAEREARRIVA